MMAKAGDPLKRQPFVSGMVFFLQTLDLAKTRPLIIGYEHGHLPPKAIGEMTAHLNAHGYDVNYGGYETDSVALRNDFLQT